MATRTPTTFTIRLVGGGVRPESVPLRRLSGVLDAVQRLVAASDVEPADVAEEEGNGTDETAASALVRSLYLLDVRRKSAGYPVYAEDAAGVVQRLQLVGRAEDEPELLAPFRGSVAPLEELSDHARKLGCQIEFRQPTQSGEEVLATIGPNTADKIRRALYLTGPSTLVGTVERVGGATNRHCGLRLIQARHQLRCSVASDDLVKELGQRIYGRVTVQGIATWYRHDWRVTHFHIQAVESYEGGTATEVFAELRRASGGAWDRVEDPEAFIAELRAL